jgi:hypothetical protein
VEKKEGETKEKAAAEKPKQSKRKKTIKEDDAEGK